jgi:hypothetical protein
VRLPGGFDGWGVFFPQELEETHFVATGSRGYAGDLALEAGDLRLWFDIPRGPFGVVAASLIATSAFDSAAIRFSQRLLGIILGMCLAIAFTVVFLPQMERIQEFELLVFGIFWLCSFINYGSQKSAFIGLQSSITFAVERNGLSRLVPLLEFDQNFPSPDYGSPVCWRHRRR